MYKVCILTIIVLCLAGNSLAQRTVYVDGSVATTGDGSLASPFKTIDEGLNLEDADLTVLVAGGTYLDEPVYNDISDGQAIVGSYDSSFTTSDPAATPTIIDMRTKSQVEQHGTFYVRARNFTIENLVIQNSTTGTSDDTEQGGAIYVRNGSDGIFRGVTFFNCAGLFEGGVEGGAERGGGAVSIRDDSTVVFEDCVFDSCVTVNTGGAVNFKSGANNAKFYRCLFTNCGAREGGDAIYNGDGNNQIEIVNCVFVNNGVDVVVPSGTYPSQYTLGIEDRRALVYNCTFVGNNNPGGSMIFLKESTNGAAVKEIINCIFANNTIAGGGSVIGYEDGYDDTTIIQNNLFFSNSGLDPLDATGAGVIGSNGNLAGDPQFIDAANGDYHLMVGSPGLDAGQTLALVTDDFEGTFRPVGEAYDIGALEGLGSLDPFFYKVRGIVATASSSAAADFGPENTVNDSGIDAWDQHDTEPTNMWLSDAGQEPPVWIKYEFDTVYKLNQMWIWNSNNALEGVLVNFGVKTATIEYSTDDDKWTALTDVPEFAQAPGVADYEHDTIVDFNGVAAKYVRITCTSTWGGQNQCGLSEVRFFYFPVQARDPKPADGAEGVSSDVTLSWKAGQQAAEHKVYISDDEQSVIDGTATAVTVSQAAYGPLSLELLSTYYWRVDEVNNANTVPVWEGHTWSFTTSEYRVVDDFESYNEILTEDDSNLVYDTWTDGYVEPPAVRTNGSTIGYTSGASLETMIVHSGRQSVPVSYNNAGVSLSEVTVSISDLPIGRDWTVGSPNVLSLWFYGDAANSATDRMYVKVNGVKGTYDGDLTQTQWQEITIDLASLGISLDNVSNLTIGFESGGSGMVFVDDIRLSKTE